MTKKKSPESLPAHVIAEPFELEVEQIRPTAPKPPKRAKPTLLVPDSVDGIQVNFCKNPACPNFGIPAEGKRTHGKGPRRPATRGPARPARYKTSGGSDSPFIQCQSCGKCPPIKSNQGIKDELDRISAYLDPAPSELLYCHTAGCDNNRDMVPVSKEDYRQFGKTASGSLRWQCKLCGKTVSQPRKSTHGQRKPHRNVSIFLDLVNKTPLKAIARKNRISMNTVYDKIEFIYRQCVAFAAHRERELPAYRRKRMEISVDRQEHVVNWFQTTNKKNIRFYAIASVDNRSGYVFGSHINYEPSLKLKDIEAEMHSTKDHWLPAPFRRYARLWLRSDYHGSVINSTPRTPKAKKAEMRLNVDEMIESIYKKAAAREDVEAYDQLDTTCRLPEWGMLVHAEYTLYAHFLFLRKLLGGVEYIRFYLDQDSGIRAACLGAFADRVLAKSCDAFFVNVGKELSQAEKLAKVKAWEWARDEFAHTNTGYLEAADRYIRRAIVLERMKDLTPRGKWHDLWLDHPYATMSEPEKRVCYLTNTKTCGFDYNDDEMAMMYDRASMHYVDSYFMQSRRLVSMLERPMTSSSLFGQKWFGYSAYRPEMVVKLVEIFRVYHNYVIQTEGTKRRRLKKGEKKRKKGTVVKKSPAQRLGLAKGRVTEEDILYFVPKR